MENGGIQPHLGCQGRRLAAGQGPKIHYETQLKNGPAGVPRAPQAGQFQAPGSCWGGAGVKGRSSQPFFSLDPAPDPCPGWELRAEALKPNRKWFGWMPVASSKRAGLRELPVSPSSMTHAREVALRVICRHLQTLV